MATEAPQDLDHTFVDESDTAQPTKEIWGRLLSDDEQLFPSAELRNDIVWFGRQGCEVNFADKRISSKHMRVFLQDNDVHIEDLSSNGTFVNSVRLEKNKPTVLKNGDEIHLSARLDPNKPVPSYTFQDRRALCQINRSSEQEKPSLKRSRTELQDDAPVLKKTSSTTTHTEEEPPTKKKSVDETETTASSKGKEKDVEVDEDDELEERLICSICHDILYKCVSLIPCLHSFCAGCYSDWMAKSKECPQCRVKVTQISRNHQFADIVETYLTKHPHKRRSPEDLKDLDDRNKITQEVLNPPRRRRHDIEDDDDDDDEHDDEDDEEDEDDDDGGPAVPLFGGIGGGGFGIAVGMHQNACHQCAPGNPTGFVCPAFGAHIYCSFCARRIADRRADPAITQTCKSCTRVCCQLYDGQCQAVNPDNNCGELRNFSFLAVPPGPLGAFRGNDYERQILIDYLTAKNISATECFRACCDKLDADDYKTSIPGLRSNTKICLQCATKAFSEMCYDYRKDIPNDQLPDAVVRRPACHWGRECRTQTNPQNPNHRVRFSHIGERTHA